MHRTTSRSALVWNTCPARRSSSMRCSVTSRPATSMRVMACGMLKPSYTGTACVTPSPLSSTTPVVRPEAYLRKKEEGRRKKEEGRRKKEEE